MVVGILTKEGGATMVNYKIEVKVEIKECNDKVDNIPQKKGQGNVKFTISGKDAVSIDRCEQALLKANYPAIRDAISTHLTKISKKN